LGRGALSTPSGFRWLPGVLDRTAQASMAAEVLAALDEAPLYAPVTPGGKPFSVRMSNLGPVGWVSDRTGYRYQPTHPVTGRLWPQIPRSILEVWRAHAGVEADPDACLINLYSPDARMGLHQDRDEADFAFPVLSISLGDTAAFRIGPAEGGKTTTLKLQSGDVCVLAGEARLARHGIDRILGGSSRLLPGGGRLNLTLRRAL
jgi:alkylated DNA repair protein (DNA oxidative demethylase)